MRSFNTVIIGSGAAGLSAALHLDRLGVKDIAIFTEGLDMGTSINTGSDKQTYYKLGVGGSRADSPVQMAADLASGGSMHGDIALIEAALSVQGFFNLVNLGVAFPHDRYGQFCGYKTDHDPCQRATSCGPYTSRDMCHALIAEIRNRQINCFENQVAVRLLTDRSGSRITGAVFMDNESGKIETVQAENIVFASGGPGGLYARSVYPECHTGAIGLALEAGAMAVNLAESQYGLASTRFRWNVSGSFMQVLPKFISTAADGSDPKEFLREYFEDIRQLNNAVFLKGYQWPFAVSHLPGSSLIDIFTYIEIEERGRRVFLDFRSDPEDLDISQLSNECVSYLSNAGIKGDTPLARLEQLNAPALGLYRQHGIDLASERLEIAVCAQHNNGGLAGNIWWESVNIRHLFPIGEVNGTHGVTRPGGSALNSGQVGALRAAEFIAARYRESSIDKQEFVVIAAEAEQFFEQSKAVPNTLDWRKEREEFQLRMSKSGAFIRESESVTNALDEAYSQYARLAASGLGGLTAADMVETLRNRQLCLAHIYYLESILMQIDYIGSRGGSLVLDKEGEHIASVLPEKWRIKKENAVYRQEVMNIVCGRSGYPEISFEKCREIPREEAAFEKLWKAYREGAIYNDL